MAGSARRRRPATVARIAVTGISTIGTFAIVGALSSAASTSSSASTDTEPPDPLTTEEFVEDTELVEDTIPVPVVVFEVHTTVYVDEHGNPIDPSDLSTLPADQRHGPAETPAPIETTRATTKVAQQAPATTVKKKKKKKKPTSGGSGGSAGTTGTTAPTCSGSSC